ncbi:MAG TPA: hypothetical protein VFT29_17040 [Gemmatimonadaceae bacterium]|nr:hypothetical protein [Gemmatimonadaceae bacterium]
MIRTTISLIALVPAVVAAQAVGASSQTKTKTEAQGGNVALTTTVDAEVAAARTRGLPEGPIAKRVAEGRAKGATETQLATAAHQVRLNLEGAAETMEKAGRTPSGDEIERGASALERGYSRADLEAVIKTVPADRSLVVAFDVLARLQDRGVGTTQALAQVQSKLEGKADDAALEALVAGSANAAVNAVPAAAVDGKATVGAAAGAAGAAAGAAAGVTTKVIKKP